MAIKPNYSDRMADYVDVAERIRQFKEQYPDGTLQPLVAHRPFEVTEVAGKTFVVYVAAAYRTPEDPRPGIGMAWEPFPGGTPYTRDSELMNAETSAWGRAIVATGIPTKKIASAEEVRNRADAHDYPFTTATVEKPPAPKGTKSRPASKPNPKVAEREAAAEAYVTAPTLEVPPDSELEELFQLAHTRGVTERQVRFWLKSRNKTMVESYLLTLPDKAGDQ